MINKLLFLVVLIRQVRLSYYIDITQDPVLEERLKEFTMPLTVEELGGRNYEREFQIINALTMNEGYLFKLISDESLAVYDRYRDVRSFRHSNVRLDDEALSPDNYINANYVVNPLAGSDSSLFILTQGPLEHTVNHFWRMVDKENSPLIVAIVEKELMGTRCAYYWDETSFNTTDYEINTYSNTASPLYILKQLIYINKAKEVEKMVQHYHVANWLDYSTLAESDYENLLSLLETLYQHRKTYKQPTVIHCSAGIGRSGTLAVILSAYEHWRQSQTNNTTFKLSIFNIVRTMRGMRFGVVQTAEQYQFIHKIISHFK